jgi:hypothetical protein
MAEEDPLVLDLFRPQLDVGLESIPRKTFTDDEDVVLPNGITNLNDEEFGRGTLFLNTNIPLGGTHLRPEGSIVGYQFFASAQFASSSTDITFLSRNPDLYNGGLRFTAVMLGKGLNMYVASIGASFAEDQDTIGDMKPRFSGLGLGTHKKSEKTTFVYGGAYTFTFGRGRVLPLFGVMWKLNSRWSLSTVLPLTVRATYHPGPNGKFHMLLTPAGDEFRFSNEDPVEFSGKEDTVFLRLTGIKLGAEWEYKASSHFGFAVQGGVIGARRLKFVESQGEDPFLDARIDPAGYLRLLARFTFGESLLDKMK